jgi:carbonic anhydrase/acetyltransferase-like protein (isoleucine patch superfamily)
MKYEFTGKTKEYQNKTLHQIKAVRDFGNIKKGTIGGWIEKESNLSHEGECWVAGNAKVFGNALVYGDAQVYGDAVVYGDAWVYGDAEVFENAKVWGNAQVFGDAWVYGNAEVWGNAQVFGNALVYGSILGKKNQVLPEELSTLPECIEEVTIRGEKYRRVTKWEKI